MADASSHRSPTMRVDARRNHTLLTRIAEDAFVKHGANASLTEIAKLAGVGIGTLYRHFPTREALLEQVLRGRFDALSARGRELPAGRTPDAALRDWLRLVIAELSRCHGLATWITASLDGGGPELAASCAALRETAHDLLERARETGTIRDDVEVSDLMRFANAIALATERSPDRSAVVDRMLTLLMGGIGSSGGCHPEHAGAIAANQGSL